MQQFEGYTIRGKRLLFFIQPKIILQCCPDSASYDVWWIQNKTKQTERLRYRCYKAVCKQNLFPFSSPLDNCSNFSSSWVQIMFLSNRWEASWYWLYNRHLIMHFLEEMRKKSKNKTQIASKQSYWHKRLMLKFVPYVNECHGLKDFYRNLTQS